MLPHLVRLVPAAIELLWCSGLGKWYVPDFIRVWIIGLDRNIVGKVGKGIGPSS